MLTQIKIMMRSISRCIIYTCFVISITAVYGQGISSLETKLQSLKERYTRESAILDSLKSVLDSRAKLIDAEKKKTDYDEGNVKKLMSVSITLSNKIDEQQNKVNGISADIEKTKSGLDKKYTTVIDSLTELENSGKYKGDADELKSRILRLTEKKILTAPKVYSLSFSPEKILSLNPSKTKDPEEKKIYTEYMNDALTEVNSKLKQVKNLNEEIGGIISLQKKTRKFLEEVEFGSNIDRTALTLRSSGNSKTTSTTRENGFYIGEESSDFSPQIQTYIYILKQLDVPSSIKTTGKFSFDNSKKNITLQEYSELLTEVEKRLTEYEEVLSNKIGIRK